MKIKISEEFYHMCVDLNKKILGTFEKIYEFGGITLEKYKELLEESSENIDVTPYFSKLYNNKKIDKCLRLNW